MRRNRVLILLAIVFAMSVTTLWLGKVLAAATLNNNEGLTVSEAGSGTIDNTLLQADDPDAPGAILTYTLVSIPVNGSLTLNGSPLIATNQFTQSDIDSNFLVYTHNDSETLADSFDFTVATSATTVPQTTFLITITAVYDQLPVVNAQSFPLNENSTAGSTVGTILATDADAGDSLTYSIVGGNVGSAFAVGSSSGVITVNSQTPLDFETNPSLTFTVQVEDLGGQTDTAVITVNLNDLNEAPNVNAGTFSVAENSANNTFVGTVSASDVDAGDTLTYSIISSSPTSAFAIGSSSGNITVSNSGQLDFETNPTFTLTVEVEDGDGLTDTAQITINLTNANDPPVLSPAGPFSIPEDIANTMPVGTPIQATDQDLSTGDSLTFSIVGGNSSGIFGIGSSNGQIIIANNSLIDFDTPPTSYNLNIRVTDSIGATDSENVVVNLTNVNEPPDVSNITFTPVENLPNGEPVGLVPADDPENDNLTFTILDGNTNSAFALNSVTGEITVNDEDELNFEEKPPPSFTLTISIKDPTNSAVESTVTINLIDQNETPMASDLTVNINENSGNGTVVGLLPAADPDIDDIDGLTFAILNGNTGGAFAIANANDGSNDGRITVANTNQLDYEVNQSFTLGIAITDTGDLGNTATVTINIINLYDEAPTVNNATFNLSQSSNNGVVVGTVSATDPELGSGDALTFAIIGGNSGSVFAINSSTGQITVPDTSKLDASTMPTFNLTVRATDKGGLVDTGTITVNVSPLPITYLYMPMVLNNYPLVEPNNLCSQAYGIASGTTYEFTADDTEDWYAVTHSSAGNLTIVLSSFEPSEGQLIIYGGSCGNLTLLQNNGQPSTTKTINLGNRPAGTYYIRVYSKPITNTTYNLRVN